MDQSGVSRPYTLPNLSSVTKESKGKKGDDEPDLTLTRGFRTPGPSAEPEPASSVLPEPERKPYPDYAQTQAALKPGYPARDIAIFNGFTNDPLKFVMYVWRWKLQAVSSAARFQLISPYFLRTNSSMKSLIAQIFGRQTFWTRVS